jgi:hypothetical protein
MTIRKKAENYAMSFFFSFTPDGWGFEELTDYLRKQEGAFDEIEDFDEDELAVWEPFEMYNPSWVADQMDMMASQLEDTFKEQA